MTVDVATRLTSRARVRLVAVAVAVAGCGVLAGMLSGAAPAASHARVAAVGVQGAVRAGASGSWLAGVLPSPADLSRAAATTPPPSSYFDAVSCPSSSFCVAVGYQANTANGHAQTLIELWRGRRWSIASSPNAPTSDYNQTASRGCGTRRAACVCSRARGSRATFAGCSVVQPR